MRPRIIYYYQTFNGLDNILTNPKCTHIHLSSIHFGTNPDGTPYIHLNDNDPDDVVFTQVWDQIEQISKKGVKIILMIGGAGGAFQTLFSDFEKYYSLLKSTLDRHSVISGIDLDIEEYVDIKNVKMLINRINSDYPNFTIAMAPIQSSLETDSPGMGGFVYKDLYNSPEGSKIDYFNVQCYGSYSASSYDAMVANGYPASKLVMGMMSGQYNSQTRSDILKMISQLVKKYYSFGGVFDWEYFDAYPSPGEWSIDMYKAIYSTFVKGLSHPCANCTIL